MTASAAADARTSSCRRCLTSLVLLILTTVVAGKTSVKWDRSNVELKQGDNLTVTCTIGQLNMLSVVRVEKRDAEKQTTMVISDNDAVKTPFSKLARYKVFFQIIIDIGTVVIQYRGVRGEDAGIIACYRPSNDQEEAETARLELKVLVPIQSVRLVTIKPDGSEHDVKSDTVTLTETTLNDLPGRGGGVACVAVVNGSLTPPALRVMVDSDDVTRTFVASEQSRILEDGTENAAAGGLGIHYGEKKLTYVTAMPEVGWNGRRLTCVASQDGFPDEMASATVNVQFIPQIKCPVNDLGADVNESASVVCEVKANPAATINWYFGDKNDTIDNETEAGILTVSTKHIDSDRTEAVLRISAVDASHIGEYRIRAQNSIGNSEERIIVRRDKSAVRQRNSNGNNNRPKESQAQASSTNQVPDSTSSSTRSTAIWCLSLSSVLFATLLPSKSVYTSIP